MRTVNHALALAYLPTHAGELKKQVYTIPEEIDQEIARLKLEAMGIRIDSLRVEHQEYLASSEEGT